MMEYELLQIVDETSGSVDYDLLRRYTYAVYPGEMHEIRWNRVEHLHIIGTLGEDDTLMPGCYISRDGTWVLAAAVAPSESAAIVEQCGERLEKLDIWDAQIECLDVSRLTGLRFLSCDQGEYARRGIVTGLSACTRLAEVYLFAMDLIEPWDVSGLKELKRLQIIPMVHARDGSSLVVGVEALSGLEQLSLYGVYGEEGLDVSRMTALQWLDLGGNRKLRRIVGLERLKDLEALCLSRSGLREIPEGVRTLKKLELLELCDMELDGIPDWMPELGLPFSMGLVDRGIILEDTTIRDVDMSTFRQSQEMILKWFEERKVPLDEIKVVFLGDGGAGKSHTIARLRNNGGDPIEYVEHWTPGIQIKDANYPLGDRKVTMHIWDFGGQEINHSMHRIFLTERTFYVVVVDGRNGDQDERARYWLKNIQSFAKDAPVILVLNKLDNGMQADVNAVELYSKFSGLKSIVKLSAKFDPQEAFKTKFIQVLLEQIKQCGYLDVRWPASWVQVKQRLLTENREFIYGEQYETICSECGVAEYWELLRWFNDLGVSFCCCDDTVLKEYVVLRPDWITNALYIILNNEREGAQGGLVPISTIRTMLGPNAPNRDRLNRVIPGVYYRGFTVDCILEVFRKFRLSFNSKGNYEFIPMLSDPNDKPVAEEYARDEATLEFQMEFPYLPYNLLHQLIVERQHELDMDNVWRTGARFVQMATGLSAVVTTDETTLRIFVGHVNDRHLPNTYLAMLKNSVDKIRLELGLQEPKCYVVYKLDGKRERFDYEKLLQMLHYGAEAEFSMVWKRPIPIRDILNQAAPAIMAEAEEIHNAILQSCRNIQATDTYINSKEDIRNERMRSDLAMVGFDAQGQYSMGLSATEKSSGKLDIVIKGEAGRIVTIIEALRIYDAGKTDWNKHLNKLLDNYNAHGAPYLFLVTYVDCELEAFTRIRESYEWHINGHAPDGFRFVQRSYSTVFDEKRGMDHFIWCAKCRYDCGGYMPTVYHIFVRMRNK